MNFEKARMRMMAMRQGLQYATKSLHEMPVRHSMVEFDADFRWLLSARLREWIADNAAGEVHLRYEPSNGDLLVCAEDPVDLTMIATAF